MESSSPRRNLVVWHLCLTIIAVYVLWAAFSSPKSEWSRLVSVVIVGLNVTVQMYFGRRLRERKS